MWGFVRNDRNVIKLSKEIWNSRRSSTSAVSNRNTAVSAATRLYSCCPQNTLSAHQNLYGAISTCQSHRLVRFVRTTDCLLTGFLHVVWMPLPRYRPLSWESKKTLSAQRRVVQNISELWSDSMQTWETLMQNNELVGALCWQWNVKLWWLDCCMCSAIIQWKHLSRIVSTCLWASAMQARHSWISWRKLHHS